MIVTDIKIRKLLHEGSKRAIVSITLDNGLAVHDLTIIETDHVFVGFPSRKDENGKHRDIVHPIDQKTRMLIEGAILKEYARTTDSRE